MTRRHPVLLALLLAACDNTDSGNAPPLADAGPDTFGAVGIEVSLDGTGSADTDDAGAPLTWRWSIERAPEGSALVDVAPFQPNDSAEAATTTFVPDVEGVYVVRLTVHDGELDSLADFVAVDVDASALLPVAVAGEDVSATEGDTVSFDGSGSTDPLQGALTWSWSLVTVPTRSHLGPDSLAGADGATPSFEPDAPGQYLASLTVTNAVGTSFPDFVAVEVASTNRPPIADITARTDLWTCFDVGLSAETSSDPDGDPLTYDWRVVLPPYGSTLGELDWDDPTASEPTFFPDVEGTYLVQLVVNDGEVDSAPAQTWLDVVPRPLNEAPVAQAGSDKFFDDTVTCTAGVCPKCDNKTVELDALDEGSYDPDGDPVTYEWVVVQGDAVVHSSTSPSTTVSLEQATAYQGRTEYYVYKLQLVMTDCLGTTNNLADGDSIVSFTYQCTGS